LHGVLGDTLLLRARRVGSDADTVLKVVHGVRSHSEYGYPSGDTLPKPGEWIVVATSRGEWGCFVLRVGE
jgi:hypothetical protein